jgi:magnesium chelatase family protein
MLSCAWSAAVIGVEAQLVRVEADTASGFPRFLLLGMPDSSMRESEGRLRAALRNCGYAFKWDRRLTVNLSPASLPKLGAGFDLAIAAALLAADGEVPAAPLSSVLLVGELALDGSLRPVRGLVPMLLAAIAAGLEDAVVPRENGPEATLVRGLRVHAVASLPEALAIAGRPDRPAAEPTRLVAPPAEAGADLADVRGQPLARRALEIAAAGRHNLLLTGPPGSGKTMLARRLPGLLPPPARDELLETASIHSAAGLPVAPLLRARPFRAPHHTASDAALVGGGSAPRPGEVSLAHRGVLFLDELPEFRRNVLEALRQPLEERHITVARGRGVLHMPARFQLVAAMNPEAALPFCHDFRSGRDIAEVDRHLVLPHLDPLGDGLDDPPLLLRGEVRPAAVEVLGLR